MALTDLKCRSAKASGKDYQLADGDGLSLRVRAKGTKLWRYQYRLDGKTFKFAYGNYPEISIIDARKLHLAARQLIESGRHPGELLDSHLAKRMILEGYGIKQLESKAMEARNCALLDSRMTFGEAARR